MNDAFDTPFAVGGEWSWPRALRVHFDGDVAVIRPIDSRTEPAELRALMLLEPSPTGTLRQPVSRVRVELSGADEAANARRAALRLGLFVPEVRNRIEVHHDGKVLPIVDALADVPELLLDPEDPKREEGTGFLPFRRALDVVRGRIEAACAGEDEVESSPIVIVSRASRPHPRLHWPVSQLSPSVARLISLGNVLPKRTGWIGELEEALSKFRESVGSKPGAQRSGEYPWILDEKHEDKSLWGPVHASLSDHEKRFLHSGVANLNSSQAFALNVLGGLQRTGLLVSALAPVIPHLARANVEFEVFDEGTRAFLGESDEHQTQIDALLTLTTEDGSMHGRVVEVKLTEPAFGACRGPHSEENERPELCEGSEPERAAGCYLKTKHKRLYLDLIHHLPPAFSAVFGKDGRCPLSSDGYQVARNLLLAHYLSTPRTLMKVERRFATSKMAVLCIEHTGARKRNASKLAQLGIEVLDARRLVAAARAAAKPEHAPFLEFLSRRYPRIF